MSSTYTANRSPISQDFRVVAIISAYNEEDIIGQVVGHLVSQGVWVYLLDHGSTDDTVAEASPYIGRGLLRIERFPDESAAPAEDARRFAWASILRRKEVLAGELEASWLIHHDADEFRESPWAHLTLREAIREVDAGGYNAVNFDLLNFWPTHDRFRRGDDVRAAFGYYEPGHPWDRIQVKCWKKTGAPVDLVSSGGHEAIFPGRRVFPLRFILRHYPIRSQAHGERKVLIERRPRFDPAERERGWHVQYDEIQEGHCFIYDAATLTAYDPHATRLQLGMRQLTSLHETLAARDGRIGDLDQALAERDGQIGALTHALAERDGQIGALTHALAERDGQIGALTQTLAERTGQVARLAQGLTDRDEQVGALTHTLAERDGQVGALTHTLAERDGQIGALTHALAERDGQIGALTHALAERDAQIGALTHALAERDAHVASLTQALADRDAQIGQFVSSRSWRLTKPLRLLSQLARGDTEDTGRRPKT